MRRALASRATETTQQKERSTESSPGASPSDDRLGRIRHAIENSPHREELQKLDSQLGKVQSPEEASQIMRQMRALLTGATGDKSLEQFREEGLDKLLKDVETATKEVEKSYGFSLGRPSTLLPFVRTNEQDKAVAAWAAACDKLRLYITDNVSQLNPDSYSAATQLASEAVQQGCRTITDLTLEEQQRAQSGMAVSGGVLAVSGTVLASYFAVQAARTGNPNVIAAAAGFAAMNLENDRFIKDLAVTSKSWDEYKQRYAEGFNDAMIRAATTGVVVAVATWTILNLKQGAIPVASLTPSLLNAHCAALATSLEVTFGAKLGQDVLQNLSNGLCDIAKGISSGNRDLQREGWRKLGDVGIDSAQLGYLGKLIEGWKPQSAPASIPSGTGSKTVPHERPTTGEPAKQPEAPPRPEPEPPRERQKAPNSTPAQTPQQSQLAPDSVFNRSPSAQQTGAKAWDIGGNRKYIGFQGEVTAQEAHRIAEIAEAPIKGEGGKKEVLLDVMGGPKSGLKDSYNIDLRFDTSSGKSGVRGDALKEISKIPDGSLDTVVINNPKTENLELTQQIIESLLKKLKPGGRIVISGQVSKNPECSLSNFMEILSGHPDMAVIQHGSRSKPELHPDIKQNVDNGNLDFQTTDGRPITSGLGSFTIVRRP